MQNTPLHNGEIVEKDNEILLIGAGEMAIEYAKVLLKLSLPLKVIGRGEQKAKTFKERTGIDVFTGGVDKYLTSANTESKTAIVAVTEEYLGDVTKVLLNFGFNKILLEKPGGNNVDEIQELSTLTQQNGANVLLGYNRRFYSSVEKAIEIIADDGGVKSFNFEFTEWGHVIRNLIKGPLVKENWFLHNSSHVIDLAFYIGGYPKEISSYKAGGLDWHPVGSIFAGAGITTTGALFSYSANWESPGRWGVEFLTNKHRLILRPLEKLQIQKLGSVQIDEYPINSESDLNFKPGLLEQTKAFVNGECSKFIDIIEQNDRMLPIYVNMLYQH